VDRIQQLYYEKEFRLRWRDARRDTFQRLFEQLMGKRYPGDFMACKPWGRQGADKSDGYSTRHACCSKSFDPRK